MTRGNGFGRPAADNWASIRKKSADIEVRLRAEHAQTVAREFIAKREERDVQFRQAGCDIPPTKPSIEAALRATLGDGYKPT